MGGSGRIDRVSKQKVDQVITPDAAINADAQSAEGDMQGYGALTFVTGVGVSLDTLSGAVSIELALEESDVSGSGFTAVADEDIIDPVAGLEQTGSYANVDDPAEDDLAYKVGYIGHKRYVRTIVNFVGTHTSGTPIAAWAIREEPNHTPTD